MISGDTMMDMNFRSILVEYDWKRIVKSKLWWLTSGNGFLAKILVKSKEKYGNCWQKCKAGEVSVLARDRDVGEGG